MADRTTLRAVVLESHPDDTVLFACFSALEHRARVVTVLGISNLQAPGITSEMREEEHARAMAVLGLTHEMWAITDDSPDWEAVRSCMRAYDAENAPEIVFAPLVEPERGHEHHDEVGRIALDVFGDRVTAYATYRRGSGRTQTGTEVEPEPGWRALKLAAMSCYVSQIDLANTRPWFASEDVLREWVA